LPTNSWSLSLLILCNIKLLHCDNTVGDNSDGRWEDNTKPKPNFLPSLAILSKTFVHVDEALLSLISLYLVMKEWASSITNTEGNVTLLSLRYLCNASKIILAITAVIMCTISVGINDKSIIVIEASLVDPRYFSSHLSSSLFFLSPMTASILESASNVCILAIRNSKNCSLPVCCAIACK